MGRGADGAAGRAPWDTPTPARAGGHHKRQFAGSSHPLPVHLHLNETVEA